MAIFISTPISTLDPYQPGGLYGCLGLILGMIWKLPYNNLYLSDSAYTYAGLAHYFAYAIKAFHYESMPIQIYWKLYHQKNENFQIKILIFIIFLLEK